MTQGVKKGSLKEVWMKVGEPNDTLQSSEYAFLRWHHLKVFRGKKKSLKSQNKKVRILMNELDERRWLD